MTLLAEKRTELEAKRAQLATIFDEIKAGTKQADADVRTEIKNRNDELSALQDEVTSLRDVDEIERKTREALRDQRTPSEAMQHPTGAGAGTETKGREQEPVNIGRLFTSHEAYQQGIKGSSRPRGAMDLDVSPSRAFKATMTTTAGFAPFPVRSDVLIPFALRRVMVPDLIPSTDITQSAIIFMQETTFTNTAAPVAEGGTKPEAALAFTQVTVPVEVIATWLPVTRQQLDDVPQIEGVINSRLTAMLQLAEEAQLLTGTGVSPSLHGFLTEANVQTQAKGADSVPAAIRKAMTLVQSVGFADPSGIVMHPNDVQDMMLLQDTTGQFIFGGPGAAAPERIWGLPIVNTTAMTENTALLGDFGLYSHIWRRMGITIDVSDSHSDFFIKNLLAIRAEERAALTIYRPTAFSTVTGI